MTIAVEAIKPYISLKEKMKKESIENKPVRKLSMVLGDCRVLEIIKFILQQFFGHDDIVFHQVDMIAGEQLKFVQPGPSGKIVLRKSFSATILFADLNNPQLLDPSIEVDVTMERNTIEGYPWNLAIFHGTVSGHPLIRKPIDLDLEYINTSLKIAVVDFVRRFNSAVLG